MQEIRQGPAWLSQDLLTKLEHNKKMYQQWRKGHTSSEDYRDMAWEYRDEIRKDKIQIELNLARDVKNNKKGLKE